MADPVSWLQLERGWSAVASGGKQLGTVSELAGDPDADGFDGVAVAVPGSGPARYVPGEQVGEILAGRVSLRLTSAEAARRHDRQRRVAEPW